MQLAKLWAAARPVFAARLANAKPPGYRERVAELILHQYEMSPFSEKVRRLLAFKKLPYRAVRAPAIMPKPELTALTGGYRKIPVLQIGNHVYCDTALIARRLERVAPEPSLYTNPLAEITAEWADSALFESTTPFIMRPTRLDDLLRFLTKEELEGMLADRRVMRENSLRPQVQAKVARVHLALYLARLNSALASQAYLFGAAPSIADFSAYHCVWMLQQVSPEPLAPHAHLQAWMQRIAAIPAPTVTPLLAAEALRISRESDGPWQPDSKFADPQGFTPEQAVTVRANDYGRDPVEGALVGSSASEIVLRRADVRAGRVYVHFPRLGFDVQASGAASPIP
jgi:glutathione S-transferase